MPGNEDDNPTHYPTRHRCPICGAVLLSNRCDVGVSARRTMRARVCTDWNIA